MSNSDDTPIEINLSDVLASCDGHARDLALALIERGGSITLAEVADIMGLDPRELVRQLLGGVIAGEAIRLLNFDKRGAH